MRLYETKTNLIQNHFISMRLKELIRPNQTQIRLKTNLNQIRRSEKKSWFHTDELGRI